MTFTIDHVIAAAFLAFAAGGYFHFWLCRAEVRATRPDTPPSSVGSQAGPARSPGRPQPSPDSRRDVGGSGRTVGSRGRTATVNRSRRGRPESTLPNARLRGVPGDQPAHEKPPGS